MLLRIKDRNDKSCNGVGYMYCLCPKATSENFVCNTRNEPAEHHTLAA